MMMISRRIPQEIFKKNPSQSLSGIIIISIPTDLRMCSFISMYLHTPSYLFISLHTSSDIFIYLQISSYTFIHLHTSSQIFIYLHISHLHLFSLALSLSLSLSCLSLFLVCLCLCLCLSDGSCQKFVGDFSKQINMTTK